LRGGALEEAENAGKMPTVPENGNRSGNSL
jgi:hypothetical protein